MHALVRISSVSMMRGIYIMHKHTLTDKTVSHIHVHTQPKAHTFTLSTQQTTKHVIHEHKDAHIYTPTHTSHPPTNPHTLSLLQTHTHTHTLSLRSLSCDDSCLTTLLVSFISSFSSLISFCSVFSVSSVLKDMQRSRGNHSRSGGLVCNRDCRTF